MSTALNDVYTALHEGVSAAEALRTWVLENKPLALGLVDERLVVLRRGVTAYEQLARELKPCNLPHVEAEPDEGCRCAVVNNPPCGWCENGGGEE